MHHFTIRDVASLSGIKAHTLRTWEQRHGLFVSKRKKSLHRFYDSDDLKFILRVAYLYHHGFRISDIAGLSPELINAIIESRLNNNELDSRVHRLLESSIGLDEKQFEQVLIETEASFGIEKAMLVVINPFLEKIRLLWMTERMMPVQERFCHYLIQKKLIAAINALPTIAENSDPCALLFNPPGANHELVLIAAQYVFKKKGFKTVMLGNETSLETIEYCCRHLPLTHFYFHPAVAGNKSHLINYIQQLQALAPGAQIIVTGPATKSMEGLPAGVTHAGKLEDLLALMA